MRIFPSQAALPHRVHTLPRPDPGKALQLAAKPSAFSWRRFRQRRGPGDAPRTRTRARPRRPRRPGRSSGDAERGTCQGPARAGPSSGRRPRAPKCGVWTRTPGLADPASGRRCRPPSRPGSTTHPAPLADRSQPRSGAGRQGRGGSGAGWLDPGKAGDGVREPGHKPEPR